MVNGTWGLPLKRRDEIAKLWDGLDPATVFFVWSDTDGDGIADPSEITFRQFPKPGGGFLPDVGLGVQVLPDLSLATTWGIHVAPPPWTRTGRPATTSPRRARWAIRPATRSACPAAGT